MRATWSGLITDVKGSLGGTVFSKWKGLMYMRVKPATIANANTPIQMGVRQTFADSVALWRGLTQVQKAEWEEYAQSLGSASASESQIGQGTIIPRKSRIQSGMNAFIGVNQMLLRAGYPRRILTPVAPTPSGVQFLNVVPEVGVGYKINDFAPAHCKPGFSTRVVVWQKLDRAGAHAHIIELGEGQLACPELPAVQISTISKVRVGTGHTVEEVPIADLLPISMFMQMVVVSEDGQKGVFSELFYLNLT